jgi:hypothetical protein
MQTITIETRSRVYTIGLKHIECICYVPELSDIIIYMISSECFKFTPSDFPTGVDLSVLKDRLIKALNDNAVQ